MLSNLKNWFGLQKQIFFESLSHDLSRKCNSGRPFIRWAQTVSPSQRQCWPHGDQALKILLQFSSPHRHDCCCCCCCCCAFYYLKHLTGGTWGGGASRVKLFLCGRDPWSSGYGIWLAIWRLWVRMFDGHFSHIFVVKIVMCVCWKDENKQKRGRGWPFLKIKNCFYDML